MKGSKEVGMAEKKEPLGFKTPAMELQDKYEEISNLLNQTKVSWSEVETSAIKDFIKWQGRFIPSGAPFY